MKSSNQNGAYEVLQTFSSLRNSFWPGILLLIFLISSCHEKTSGQNSKAKKESSVDKKAEDKVKPKVTVNVNRHYDDKGNLIGFDSTYSSFYSNTQRDTATMDSLFARFNKYFNGPGPSLMTHKFNSLFFRDSILYPDFFHDDFFMKRYELNDAYMRNMMRQMDSIKNKFYEQESRKKIPKRANP